MKAPTTRTKLTEKDALRAMRLRYERSRHKRVAIHLLRECFHKNFSADVWRSSLVFQDNFTLFKLIPSFAGMFDEITAACSVDYEKNEFVQITEKAHVENNCRGNEESPVKKRRVGGVYRDQDIVVPTLNMGELLSRVLNKLETFETETLEENNKTRVYINRLLVLEVNDHSNLKRDLLFLLNQVEQLSTDDFLESYDVCEEIICQIDELYRQLDAIKNKIASSESMPLLQKYRALNLWTALISGIEMDHLEALWQVKSNFEDLSRWREIDFSSRKCVAILLKKITSDLEELRQNFRQGADHLVQNMNQVCDSLHDLYASRANYILALQSRAVNEAFELFSESELYSLRVFDRLMLIMLQFVGVARCDQGFDTSSASIQDLSQLIEYRNYLNQSLKWLNDGIQEINRHDIEILYSEEIKEFVGYVSNLLINFKARYKRKLLNIFDCGGRLLKELLTRKNKLVSYFQRCVDQCSSQFQKHNVTLLEETTHLLESADELIIGFELLKMIYDQPGSIEKEARSKIDTAINSIQSVRTNVVTSILGECQLWCQGLESRFEQRNDKPTFTLARENILLLKALEYMAGNCSVKLLSLEPWLQGDKVKECELLREQLDNLSITDQRSDLLMRETILGLQNLKDQLETQIQDVPPVLNLLPRYFDWIRQGAKFDEDFLSEVTSAFNSLSEVKQAASTATTVIKKAKQLECYKKSNEASMRYLSSMFEQYDAFCGPLVDAYEAMVMRVVVRRKVTTEEAQLDYLSELCGKLSKLIKDARSYYQKFEDVCANENCSEEKFMEMISELKKGKRILSDELRCLNKVCEDSESLHNVSLKQFPDWMRVIFDAAIDNLKSQTQMIEEVLEKSEIPYIRYAH